MATTPRQPLRPVMGYFAYWIDRLRLADTRPAGLAHHGVRTALHEAPPARRPAATAPARAASRCCPRAR